MLNAIQLYTAFLLVYCLLSVHKAYAAGVAGIGNARVNEGQLTLSLREVFGTDNDGQNLDNRWRQRFMADYGFTNWFASGLYLQGDKRDGTDMEYEALLWDSRFEFTEVKKDGFYSGMRFRYTLRDADKKPDNIHLRGIIGVPVGQWEFRYNQIVYMDVGSQARSGIGLDTRLQVNYEYIPDHRVGIESFHDSGKLRDLNGYHGTSHDMGIVFTGTPAPEWSYETGYAHGISGNAPDHTVKLFINHTF